MGAGTRKSLVLFWTALFVCSLLLQYVVAASPVLAVHDEGLFELDGNAVDSAAAGDDWNSTNNAQATVFIPGSAEDAAHDTSYFTSGGSKDVNDISQWAYTTTDIAPDKDQILDAFGAAYKKNGDTFVYFGADRFDGSGDSFVGFWFVQDKLGLDGNGGFTGVHKNGDILVVSDFTNGGVVSEINVYEWLNGNLSLKASGAQCDVGPDSACAVVNAGTESAPWSFLDKSGSSNFAAGEFYEGGINLDTVFGGDAPCFSSFIAETRSSQSTTAQLKDFALGSFDTCQPPTIDTASSVSSADFGGQVTDTATLSGTDGPASGSVKFFVCGPTAQVPDCSTGGTQVGNAVTVATSANGGTATSSAYTIGATAAAAGNYCWRAEYTPDANSQYLAGSHTNKTTECFNVAPATIKITKTANPAGPVSAGSDIGFDVKVENTGTQTTLGIHVTDPLPGSGWTADAPTGTDTTGLSCSITSNTLDCTKPSLGAGKSFTVHIHRATSAADCPSVSNTASVATSNDGSGQSTDSVTVQCPDVKVTKTPDGSKINAGDTATFTIKVENIGAGTANDVVVTDNLPAGVHWTESENDCSISGADGAQVLTCNVGSLAPAASKTYTVSAVTSKENCGDIDNTASATASNEPPTVLANNTDDGSITVLCAVIGITKTADADSVSAGDPIGFTVTVTNSGDGLAHGVTVGDPLPVVAGVSWSIDGANSDAGWTIDNGTLKYGPADLAAGDSVSVHIVSGTTAASCGTVDNTASVTSSNDGSGQASASVDVLCADVSITKKADAGSVNAGDSIGFTVTVTNSGQGDAHGLAVTDPLPVVAGLSWSISPANADWTIDNGVLKYVPTTLAAGVSASVHITSGTTGESCGTVDNTAAFTTTNDGSGQASDSVDVLCPDIHVKKTADNSPISAGEKASFTITVSNDGQGVAKDVELTDTLPAGVNWVVDDTADCSITGGVLSCSFGTMAAGDSVSINISGETTADNCGTIPNTASATASNESADDSRDNSGSASIVVNCPKIGIVKTPDDPVVNATDQIGFTVTVTNSDAGSAFGVTVDDPLPTNSGLNFTIDPANAAWTIDNGHLKFGPATLAGNSSVSVHIVSPTTPETCGNVHNVADLTYDGGTGSDVADITVQCPDVRITKTADNSPILAGQTASYTIKVWNAGDGTAYGVTLNDPLLPAGITWTDNSAACDVVSGTLTCDFGDLAPGQQASVTVSGTSAADSCADLPNLATVSATNEADADTDNNQAGATIDVQCASIDLVKTAGNAPDGTTLNLAKPGNVVFTYVVTNTGTAALENIALVDDNATPANKADDVTIICPKTTLSAGESMTCTATLPVGYDLRTNIATVTANPVLDAEGQVSATDDAAVNVPRPEITPTPTPRITLPPTSTVDGGRPDVAGSGLYLVLLVIAGMMLAAGYLVPATARARKRDRRS